MLLVYTGDGKGKTSACVGQAIRAAGQGLPVAFVQFMKSDVQAGEQKMLAALTGITLHIGGCGFFLNEENRALHRDAALRTLEWATRHLDGLFMILLDEVLYALQLGLLERRELENFLVQGKQKQVHLVLSGRALPSWLEDMADLVTEMREIKHPWRKGIKAQPGIEF